MAVQSFSDVPRIGAPSSTKNPQQQRDLEKHQTRKSHQ